MIHVPIMLLSLSNLTVARDGNFVLSFATLAAFRCGPHVVELSVTYFGEKQVLARMSRSPAANVTLTSRFPGVSTFRVNPIVTDTSTLPEDVLFSTGTKVTQRYYLHRRDQSY